MAAPQIINVGPAPQIMIEEVSGNLSLSGWDRPEMQVRTRGRDELTVDQLGELITIRCDGDCTMLVPLQAAVQIGEVHGDAQVNLLLGKVDIEEVDGNLSVSSVGSVTIGEVDGDLTVRSVAGTCQVESVDGNARVARVAGDLNLHEVDGDLHVTEVVGSLQATVDGNASLTLRLTSGQAVMVTADGDINCQVEPGAGAHVMLKADGDIRVRNLGEPRRGTDTMLDFTVGDGSATLHLTADGNITLRGTEIPPMDLEADFGAELSQEMALRAAELSQQITSQVESQVETLSRELEEKLSQMGTGDEMASRIQERVTGALRRAEEKLAEAMRKMEVRVQEAERRGPEGDGRRRKAYAWQAPQPPIPPVPPAPPRRPRATDEERMMILRMVEQGKVSVEQAEKLLAALNGEQEKR
jgi:ElaB/YqjD/DUF883 family membrane-anchored ribosome-binding protein